MRHINSKHQDQGLERIKKPIVCKEEGCTFVSVYGNLKRHIETKHEGIVRFKCHVMNCSFGSVEQKELRKHIRTHAVESPKIYKCNQCDYASDSASSVKSHLKIHTGDKSHKCNQCDYASYQASVLRTHLKIHAGEIEKVHRCKQCDYASVRAAHLKRHLITHNGEKIKQKKLL